MKEDVVVPKSYVRADKLRQPIYRLLSAIQEDISYYKRKEDDEKDEKILERFVAEEDIIKYVIALISRLEMNVDQVVIDSKIIEKEDK